MAIGVIVRFPEGAGAAEYDKVNAELDPRSNPIEGCIFHSAGELEGRFQVFDVWETPEHAERFEEERLIPAMKAAYGEEQFAAMPDAERVQVQIHDYQVG